MEILDNFESTEKLDLNNFLLLEKHFKNHENKYYTRKQIVDLCVKNGGNKDLIGKGMACDKNDNIYCISSHSKKYKEDKNFSYFLLSPRIYSYWGTYPKNYYDPLNEKGAESRKNLKLIETKNNNSFIYIFERISNGDRYYFHGSYKYESHILSINEYDELKRGNSILFSLKLQNEGFENE